MLKTAISYAVINAVINKSLVGWTIEFPILTSNTIFLPNINFEDVIAVLREQLHKQQEANRRKNIDPKLSPITNFELHEQYSIEALQQKFGYDANIYPIKYQII